MVVLPSYRRRTIPAATARFSVNASKRRRAAAATDVGGYDERRLIKITLTDKIQPEEVARASAGVEIVSQEEGTLLLAFATEQELEEFEAKLARLAAGEGVTYLNVIYALRDLDHWSPEDRTGWALRRDGFRNACTTNCSQMTIRSRTDSPSISTTSAHPTIRFPSSGIADSQPAHRCAIWSKRRSCSRTRNSFGDLTSLSGTLELSSCRRLRAKAFLRSDQFDESGVADFPDAKPRPGQRGNRRLPWIAHAHHKPYQ